MSFSQQSAAPSLQDPASGRVNRWRQAEPLPWANGPFRLAPHWVSDRFNDAWTNGKQTGQAYCSVVGNICHGPIDRALYIYKDGEQIHQINVTRPNDPEDPHYWYVDFEFGGTSDGLPNYSGRLYWGREDQPVDDWLIATSGQDHPPRRGVCYVIWKRLHCGQVQANSKARPALPNIEIVGVRLISPTVPSALRLPAAYGNPALAGVNLVGGLFDILTHPRAGIDCAALLDTATWTAAATAVDTGAKKIAKRWGEEVHIAPVHAGQEDAEKLVDDYLSYCDGWLPIRDGKIGIDWYPNDGTVPASLPEISDHDLVLGEDETAEFGDYQDLPTLIVANGLDFQTQLGEAVVTAPVPLVRSITGRNNPEKVDRPWIVNADYLQDYANSLATLAVTLPAKGEISVRRDRAVRLDGTPLLPGDLFKLTLMRHSFSSVCRVLERMEDDRGADVTIKWCRERGTNGLVYAPPTDPRDRYALPEPETPGANDWTVVETPPDIGSGSAVVLCRKTQPTLSGITVAIDDDDSWGAGGATLGEQGFATRIIVGSSPGPSATAATIDVVIEGDGAAALLGSGATQSEQIDNTWLLVLGSEWLSVGAVTSLMGYTYRFAVLRGRLGSTAAPHDTASYGWVVRRDLLQIWAHALFTAEATRYFKVRTYHTLAESDYSASKPVTFRIPPRRRISFYTFARAPLGGVAKHPQEIFDAMIGPFPLGTDHSSLTAIEMLTGWERDIPQPTVGLGGPLAGSIALPGDIIIPPQPELGPLTLYYCSGEFDDADNYVRDTWSDVAPIAGHMATPTALINNAGTFLESIKSTDLASAWSSKIVAGGISIQIRKNPSTNTLEWTPDGGTTVHAMGGGGGTTLPTPTIGQMLYCAEAGTWAALPAPGVVGQVLTATESGAARIPQWVLPTPAYAPRVQLWLDRISIAGGTLTDYSESIAISIISAMHTRSWAGKVVYLLPFLGRNLAAALIPLVDTRGVGAPINTGFVTSDYSEATGLQGAATKWLNIQITAAQLGTAGNGGIGVVERGLPSPPVAREEGGYDDSGIDRRYGHYARTSSPWRIFWWGHPENRCESTGALAPSHVYGQRAAATDRRLYVNGQLAAPINTTSDPAAEASATPLYAVGCQAGNSPDYGDPIRCGAWYATDGTLTDAEVADIYAFLQQYLITPTGR